MGSLGFGEPLPVSPSTAETHEVVDLGEVEACNKKLDNLCVVAGRSGRGQITLVRRRLRGGKKPGVSLRATETHADTRWCG